jgi:hypothetical protein
MNHLYRAHIFMIYITHHASGAGNDQPAGAPETTYWGPISNDWLAGAPKIHALGAGHLWLACWCPNLFHFFFCPIHFLFFFSLYNDAQDI